MADDKLYETLKNSALAYVKAFESPNPFNPEQVYSHRAPGSITHFHPSNSFPPPFGNDADIGWDEHHEVLRMLGALVNKCKCYVQQVVVDVKTRTVVVRFQEIFDFKPVEGEPEERDYMVEHVWIMEHDENGEKVVAEETMDAQRASYMMSKAMRYAEENAK